MPSRKRRPKHTAPAIGVENAKKIAAVALADAKRNNWYIAVAVVDPSGTLAYDEKNGQHSNWQCYRPRSRKRALPPCSNAQPRYSSMPLPVAEPVCGRRARRERFQSKAASPSSSMTRSWAQSESPATAAIMTEYAGRRPPTCGRSSTIHCGQWLIPGRCPSPSATGSAEGGTGSPVQLQSDCRDSIYF